MSISTLHVSISTLQKISIESIMKMHDLTFDDLIQYGVLSYSWAPNISETLVARRGYTLPKSIDDLSHYEAARIISEYYEKLSHE